MPKLFIEIKQLKASPQPARVTAKGVSPCVLALPMSIQLCRRIAGGQIRLALIVCDQAELLPFFFSRRLTLRFSPSTTKKIV